MPQPLRVDAGGVGLSQLLAWPTEHLTEAAEHWEAVGTRSYGVAHQVWRDALSVDWRGEAADALRTTSHADMLTTSAVADQLHDAARVARSGASDLYAARSRIRYAVDDARGAGFAVGEDLSITDRVSGGSGVHRAARNAEARAFTGDIRRRAVQLLDLDRQVAAKVTAAVAGIRDALPRRPALEDNRARPVDNHTFRQDPPPPASPYPINDVLAEATDQDGNRVLLRRGYYDASTGKGFGWDKAYWRHGVVNMNVFKDLISHSRPVRSEGAVLTYEVQINRTRCTTFLGLPDCQDTGERLIMVIKVDTAEDIPTNPTDCRRVSSRSIPLRGAVEWSNWVRGGHGLRHG